VQSEVIAVDGRKVTFRASAHDGHDLISEGTHERMVIDVARFAARLQGKRGST
jgi:fluoroacetyl-CoA thioesterase